MNTTRIAFDVRQHARVAFPRMLKGLFNSARSGAVGTIVSIAWEAFWLVGPPLGLASDSDRKAFLLWGLFALAICSFQAFFVLIRENKQLKINLDDKQKLKKAKELIGKILEQLSHCEMDAYHGDNSPDYDKLIEEIEELKHAVHHVATKYLDGSFESRFLSVNVLDIQLDEPTQMNFISRSQGSFWTIYQQIKGWRIYLNDVLKELKDC